MNGWSWYWVGWVGTLVVSFLIPEVWSLATHHSENTLSANLWRLQGDLPGESPLTWTAVHVLMGGCLFLVLIWLAFHFFFGLWH